MDNILGCSIDCLPFLVYTKNDIVASSLSKIGSFLIFVHTNDNHHHYNQQKAFWPHASWGRLQLIHNMSHQQMGEKMLVLSPNEF